MKKNKIVGLVFVIVITITIIWFSFRVIPLLDSLYKNKGKLNCADYFVEKINNDVDLLQLCQNKECVNYFESRIELNMGLAQKCLEEREK